jgi:hypothetical protein
VIIPKYLDCSIDYRRLALDDIELFKIVNGCGAAGSKFDFVPDTIFGLPIKHACYIHDHAYSVGQTLEDKVRADNQFLCNLIAIINSESVWFLKWPRRQRALLYFNMVCDMGYSAFWAGKKHPVHISESFTR